eukprot:Ihof_evm2s162 gene=Ihof_evmTU2s162
MPLRRKEEWQPRPPPKGIEPDDLVFHIPFTGEVFLEYEDYIDQLQSYTERQWVCALSGKKNLTLEEAFESEKTALAKINCFPATHLEPVLRLVHHASANAELLVERIYDIFRDRYVIGDTVIHTTNEKIPGVSAVITAVHESAKAITLNNGDIPLANCRVDGGACNESSECISGKEVKEEVIRTSDNNSESANQDSTVKKETDEAMAMMDDNLSINNTAQLQETTMDIDNGYDDDDIPLRKTVPVDLGRKEVANKSTEEREDNMPLVGRTNDELGEETGPVGPIKTLVTRVGPTYHYDITYTSGMEKGTTATCIPSCELSRKKHPLPKAMLKAFIRDSAKREPYVGAIWVVKDEYIKRFGLAEEVPEAVAALRDKWSQKEAAKNKRKQEVVDAVEQEEQERKKQKMEDKKRVEKIQYPIEDTQLPLDPSLQERPIESTDFSVGAKSAPALLTTWHFLYYFSSAIKLSRFSLDNYQYALLTDDNDVLPKKNRIGYYEVNPLLCAIYRALLNALADDVKEDAPSESEGGDMDLDARSVSTSTTDLNTMAQATRHNWEEVLMTYIERQLKGSHKVLVPAELQEPNLGFATLNTEGKLTLVGYLVDEVARTASVRRMIDDNIESARVLAQERRMERAAYKKILKEEAVQRRRLRMEQRDVEGEDDNDSDDSDASDHTEDLQDMPVMDKGRGSRRAFLDYQRMVRENEMKKRQQELEEQRKETAAKNAAARALAAERKRIEDQEREEQKRESKYQESMLRLLGVRPEPLGQDRFYNTYWYLDPTRLVVEHTDGVFGFFTSPQEIDQLIGHLNMKGVRELDLLTQLNNLYKPMHTAMRRHTE